VIAIDFYMAILDKVYRGIQLIFILYFIHVDIEYVVLSNRIGETYIGEVNIGF
jgi:hypothetical protein